MISLMISELEKIRARLGFESYVCLNKFSNSMQPNFAHQSKTLLEKAQNLFAEVFSLRILFPLFLPKISVKLKDFVFLETF